MDSNLHPAPTAPGHMTLHSHDLGPESQPHFQIDYATPSYAHDAHSPGPELACITFQPGSPSTPQLHGTDYAERASTIGRAKIRIDLRGRAQPHGSKTIRDLRH